MYLRGGKEHYIFNKLKTLHSPKSIKAFLLPLPDNGRGHGGRVL